MLVLSRKVGESLRIADNVEITVVRIVGNHVRLGVTAPPAVPILRGDAKHVTPPAKRSA